MLFCYFNILKLNSIFIIYTNCSYYLKCDKNYTYAFTKNSSFLQYHLQYSMI